jgi:hypothetical protein
VDEADGKVGLVLDVVKVGQAVHHHAHQTRLHHKVVLNNAQTWTHHLWNEEEEELLIFDLI